MTHGVVGGVKKSWLDPGGGAWGNPLAICQTAGNAYATALQAPLPAGLLKMVAKAEKTEFGRQHQ